VLLEHRALVLAQGAGLEPHGVRDADLADVVQRRGVAQVLDGLGRQPELLGQQRGGAADALGVLVRVVVAVLGGHREALERLAARVLEVGGTGADPALEILVAVLERALQAARLEQVADAEEDLDAVERLGDEVAGAETERAAARRRGVVGGEDEDRHAGAHDPLEQREAVDLGDLEVEHDEIGVDELEHVLGLAGDARHAHVLVAGGEHARTAGRLSSLDDDDALRLPFRPA
jgi:hypothetical protein